MDKVRPHSNRHAPSRRELLQGLAVGAAAPITVAAISPALRGLLGVGLARAAEPGKTKIGILLPLTGTFAAEAQTQKQGALLAIDAANARGGLDMPGGKMLLEGVVDDDEAKLDVGVRRYRYMLSEGVKGLGGQTWAPLAYVINSLCIKNPMTYFPLCVMAKEGFQKGKLADATFATAYSPWTVGYMSGYSAVKTLGKKRIYFLARSDSWGWDIRDGVYAAAKEHGAQIVGTDAVALGTSDFTTVLQKVQAAKLDVFISAQFGADAVALLKQVHQMGLGKDTTIFNAFITNVVREAKPRAGSHHPPSILRLQAERPTLEKSWGIRRRFRRLAGRSVVSRKYHTTRVIGSRRHFPDLQAPQFRIQPMYGNCSPPPGRSPDGCGQNGS